MKVAIINDTHCGIRNSSDIFLDNAEKFWNDVFFPTLLERGIRHIIHLGDYFDHRKFINFRALNRNRHVFLERIRKEKITMDIICGNHDTYYKNTNELNSEKKHGPHMQTPEWECFHPWMLRRARRSAGEGFRPTSNFSICYQNFVKF